MIFDEQQIQDILKVLATRESFNPQPTKAHSYVEQIALSQEGEALVEKHEMFAQQSAS